MSKQFQYRGIFYGTRTHLPDPPVPILPIFYEGLINADMGSTIGAVSEVFGRAILQPTPGLTNFLENLILNHVFRNVIYSPPTLYCGLFITEPNELGFGVEVNSSGYSRAALPGFDAAAAGAMNSNTDLEFPTAPVDWGVVQFLSIHDDPTSGNMLMWGQLDDTFDLGAGVKFVIPAGDLTLTMD